MINFVDLVPGNRFVHEGKRYMKLAAELCDFNNLGAGFVLRLNIDAQEGPPAVGRVAVIYNSVDLNSGGLKSFQSEDLIEADMGDNVKSTARTEGGIPKKDENYTF